MLTFTGNVVILVLAMAASLVFTLAMNRLWPVAQRYAESDLVGWQLSVPGTTYAVTLGFMLYTVWGEFKSAELNIELEANALRDIYRLAQGLPHDRAVIERLAVAYATEVVERDWPEMNRGVTPEESHEANEHLWTALLSAVIEKPMEIAAHDTSTSRSGAGCTWATMPFAGLSRRCERFRDSGNESAAAPRGEYHGVRGGWLRNDLRRAAGPYPRVRRTDLIERRRVR